MPRVRVPTVLRRHTGGQTLVSASGGTVGAVLRDLVRDSEEFEEQLFDGDALRGYVNVYVDDEDIRYLDGLDTVVADDDEVAIMPAVAGGA